MKNFDYLSLSAQQLLTFVTLHEVGTVTATAEKLETTQSAVSHNLQKLRQIFDDELFVRAGRSIAPTYRSQQIYPDIKAVLSTLSALTQAQDFTPENADIAYKIYANDYQGGLFLSQLYARVAPQVRSLSMEISPSKKPTLELLRSSNVDMAFSPMTPDGGDIMATRIFSDVPHCFYDPAIRGAPKNLDDLRDSQLLSLTFMKGISLGSSTHEILQILDKNTCIRVANFSSIPEFILGTDLLTIMPSMLANTLSYQTLAHAPTPYQTNTLNMYMLWHRKYQQDAQHRWFREQVSAATAHLR